ncbi:dd3292e5-bb48-432e-9c6d-252aaf7ae78a [Sclerotinia trifoliorum]|uniref:Dd3292e5-bb48-432e-9c6d-252aaf7ae78a n=1 Tax=Sclerotinia trifoliorum TaxID=28548 RepID=A0A8H2ZTQ7_9HELO|nr:dd3292e5-bb48-432e-9c6d-252aaf7ae78a [Sclerotinia trifoliorum]
MLDYLIFFFSDIPSGLTINSFQQRQFVPQRAIMFTLARSSAIDRIYDVTSHKNGIPLLPSNFLPESYTFEDLYRELVKKNEAGKDEELVSLLILASCLKEKSNIVEGPDDEKWYEKFEDYLSNTTLPDGKVFSLDKHDEEQSDQVHKAKQRRDKYSLCILSISYLLEISSKSLQQPKNSTLLSLIPFTSTENPWTTPQSQQIATKILEKHSFYVQSSKFLVTYLLISFIRPIFSEAAAPKSITASSRKAAPSSAPPRHLDIRESSPSRQPWRSNIPHTITVLQWIIGSISPEILRTDEVFPQLVPALLILLDSPSNPIRIHALRLLPSLFSKMGKKLLIKTGLGEVFEDAIHPVLLFLPSITPVEDTLKLLPVGYEALYAICDAKWPERDDEQTSTGAITAPTSSLLSQKTNTAESTIRLRLAFLDKIIRHAILPAYTHCQEIPSVVEILISQIGIIIPKMKISGVKHLKNILPIISNILINPFFPDTSPSLIIKTLRTLREVILVLWPRISVKEHRLLILRALGLLYCNTRSNSVGRSVDRKIVDVEAETEITKELQETGKVFVAAVQMGDDEAKEAFGLELDTLVQTEGGLASIFPV